MRKPVLLLIPAIFYFLSAFSQFSPGDYALKDVSVIDGISNNVKSHYTIVIHNNHIEEVGPVNEISIPDSVTVFYYPGKYVIPGLIDSHVHLATDPSDEDNRRRAEKDLKDMLLSGITSVRDMACYGESPCKSFQRRGPGRNHITGYILCSVDGGSCFFQRPENTPDHARRNRR